MTTLSYGSALSGHVVAGRLSSSGLSHILRAQVVAAAVDALADLTWRLAAAPFRVHARLRDRADLMACDDRLLQDIGVERTGLSHQVRRVDWH